MLSAAIALVSSCLARARTPICRAIAASKSPKDNESRGEKRSWGGLYERHECSGTKPIAGERQSSLIATARQAAGAAAASHAQGQAAPGRLSYPELVYRGQSHVRLFLYHRHFSRRLRYRRAAYPVGECLRRDRRLRRAIDQDHQPVWTRV